MRIYWILLLLPKIVMAAEGMWTLDNLPKEKMHAEYGFTANEAWVKRAMLGSVRIAGGCSASFVSKEGLVMTNHHCAASCLDQLSTEQKNLVKNGFLAKTRMQELQCPEIELNRLENITDVTQPIREATDGLEGTAFKSAQNAAKAKLIAACVGKDRETVRCDVVDLYHGGQYHLYHYHRFQDTRLVWAPEKAIAFFGGDPDNFNFPRYDLDVTLLRAYQNGKPAQIESYFPFSRNGAEKGEMVFVTGHPGATQRQLTLSQLTFLRDFTLLNNVVRLAEMRGVLAQYSKSSPEAARTAEHMLFNVENSYKAFRGRLNTLQDPLLLQKKQDEEADLRRFVAQRPELQEKVGGAWEAIAASQQAFRRIEAPYNMMEGGRAFNSRYFMYARALVRGAQERTKPNSERLPEYIDATLPEQEQELFSNAPIYPAFEKVMLGFSLTKMREILGPDDNFVQQVLGKQSPDQRAAALIDQSTLGDPGVRKALWQGGLKAIMQSQDPFIKLNLAIDPASRAIRKRYEQEVSAIVQKNSALIAQARFAQQGTQVYPDATFTLRLSYGEIQGWQEGDKWIEPFTNLGGAFERATGVDPYALPQSWYTAKNKLNLSQRYNFSTTNDIIGGNSGSPMINRNGEIVGLIFDGNIHSLGGAFWFDPRFNRTVAVHSGAILETLEKVYGGDGLVKEILAQ